MMSASKNEAPEWDTAQLEVVLESANNWQLVVAGPGVGKSAVACQRAAFLVDDGVAASKILLLSFTRTAVAEIRNRLNDWAGDSTEVRNIRIATIDSHAWALLHGFENKTARLPFGASTFDVSIQRAIDLFNTRNEQLLEFVRGIEHLLIDEAQDVIGPRAELVMHVLRELTPSCGVTVLADPAQAIYGFTSDDLPETPKATSLVDELAAGRPRPFILRHLKRIYRTANPSLLRVFNDVRVHVEDRTEPRGHLHRIKKKITEVCDNDLGQLEFKDLAEKIAAADQSTLLLFRSRAEALMASSYLSSAKISHRLRMSGLPTVVQPWIGCLLAEIGGSFLSEDAFREQWLKSAAHAPRLFVDLNVDVCWGLLHHIAGAARPRTVDLYYLRQILTRRKPPIEICLSEGDLAGPIVGTIHASKGREANTVILVLPRVGEGKNGSCDEEIFEEGRVYYVGATRARQRLAVAAGTSVIASHLKSGRVFRRFGDRKVQLEIGRDDDVERWAHATWDSACLVQQSLALAAPDTTMKIVASEEDDYAPMLVMELQGEDGIKRYPNVGAMSEGFDHDLREIWGLVDYTHSLRPPVGIPHIYLSTVTTIGVPDDALASLKPPYNQSGIILAPVIRGFPTITFVPRSRWRHNGD